MLAVDSQTARSVLIDGLALGAMPTQIEHEASRLRVIALLHMPLASEVGIDPEVAAVLEVGSAAPLRPLALVVVTGTSTAGALARYGVTGRASSSLSRARIARRLARGSDGPILHLLCVATLNPGKGHDILFRALAAVPQRNWRLTCAGSVDRSPATVERLRTLLRTHGSGEAGVGCSASLTLTPSPSAMTRPISFVLATLMKTYGMAVG